MTDDYQGAGPYAQARDLQDTPYKKVSGLTIVLATIGIVVALLLVVVVGGVIYIGTQSPETSIYTQNQVPAKYVESARDAGLISYDETVLFFYSDAMFSAKNAMYILTDRHLVLLNKEWQEPKRIIAPSEILAVGTYWSDTWTEDSWVTVELTDGETWTFPLSMENDTDHRFVEKLCEMAGINSPE